MSNQFSIRLNDDTLENVNKFIISWNKQFLLKIDRASAIRKLLEFGLQIQDAINICPKNEDAWIHLKIDGKIQCQNPRSQKAIGLESGLEAEISCPVCKTIARHHPSKLPKTFQQTKETDS